MTVQAAGSLLGDRLPRANSHLEHPALRQVLEVLASDPDRSAEQRSLPYGAIDAVRETRLGALRLPVEMGGADISLRQLFGMVTDIAAIDPDVAHILRNHYWLTEEWLRSADIVQRELWLQRVADGKILSTAATEAGAKTGLDVAAPVGAEEQVPTTPSIATKLASYGHGFLLNGEKQYNTGAALADWIVVFAANPDDAPVFVAVERTRDGVSFQDDWDGIGQRATSSGSGRFEDVFVAEDEVLSLAPGAYVGAFTQLYLAAVVAGILRSVVEDAVDHVHSRKRSYSHAPTQTLTEDPLLQSVIGQLSSIAYTADSLVATAAESLDRAAESVRDGVADEELAHEAALAVARTQVALDPLAPLAATRLFEIGGASSIRRIYRLDRHWRNIRTITAHNPIMYKQRAIGDYDLTGIRLPLNGFF